MFQKKKMHPSVLGAFMDVKMPYFLWLHGRLSTQMKYDHNCIYHEGC